jgi:hypothetical protein
LGPGKPDRDARPRDAFMENSVDLLVPEGLLNNSIVDHNLLKLLGLFINSVPVSNDATDRAYRPFEVPDARLHRVAGNKLFDFLFIEQDEFF